MLQTRRNAVFHIVHRAAECIESQFRRYAGSGHDLSGFIKTHSEPAAQTISWIEISGSKKRRKRFAAGGKPVEAKKTFCLNTSPGLSERCVFFVPTILNAIHLFIFIELLNHALITFVLRMSNMSLRTAPAIQQTQTGKQYYDEH